MTFGWPWLLLGLLVVPLVVWWYRQLLRSRAARRAELAALGLVAPAAAGGRRRFVPPALFLVALVLLLAALARPEATVPNPRREGTVILAFDVSASMGAKDLTPSRIDAAKAAARTFVEQQPASVRLGVVAFSGSGLVAQEPTADRTSVLAAIQRLTPSGGTALARGLQTALSAIVGRTVLVDAPSDSVEPQGQDLGYHGSAAIVLLSDGENTVAPDPLDVAQLASSAGVKVYPIGLGRPEGTVLDIDGFQVATALDEPLLKQIASLTDGRYFAAADEQELAQVYRSIDLEWTAQPERIEITALFAAVAALLVLVGVGLSFAWFGRAVW
ncbi:vWA domain-containing protein [Pseudonocardia sp. GCM10023141]|uniref:vWA domain-containing protein n=1 Tax=Pseudonocardia sp. GCM10023141 TaxID=3252653 RepID=UPI0036091905